MRLSFLISCLAALASAITGCGPNQNAAPSPNMSVFVTSVGIGDGGNLGGLPGADKHCQTLAGAAGAGDRTWHAYLSAHSEPSGNATAGTDAVARAAAGGTQAAFARYRIGEGPWFNARGDEVAKDLIELHTATRGPAAARILDETGDEISDDARAILTGARPDGTAFPASDDLTCGNWRKNAGGHAQIGRVDNDGGSWNSAAATNGCSETDLAASGSAGLFYCFSAPSRPAIAVTDGHTLIEKWPTLPARMNGGKWGELIRAQIDRKGDIWVFHRCFNNVPAGNATCVGRDNDPPILKFDRSGKLLASFGQGIFAFPHGFTVDEEGNVWASDAQSAATVLGMSTTATAGPFKGSPRGHQVFKFSPEGKVLMTLGKAGARGDGPDTFDAPTGVAIASNGDIFVSDGHGRNDRIVKFSKDGRFIKTWGRHGVGPGEFDQPHDIALDSRNRVFVADRSNNRVQIFDADGGFIAEWRQFGRPSAVFVSPDDLLYVSDSYSNARINPGFRRGIYIGSAITGVVSEFIADPDLDRQEQLNITGASGIAADVEGTIYAADVGPQRLRKYVRK
jgi:DNA-binding beta-propeller fold protein YncE